MEKIIVVTIVCISFVLLVKKMKSLFSGKDSPCGGCKDMNICNGGGFN